MSLESTSTSMQRLIGQIDLARTYQQVLSAARHPGDNRAVAILLLGCVAVALAMLVLFALMLVTPSRRKIVKVRRYHATPEGAAAASAAAVGAAAERAAGSDSQHDAEKVRPRWILGVTSPFVIGALVVLALTGAYVATSTDSYCARTCHVREQSVQDAREADHSSCRSCHEGRLVLDALANTAQRTRMVVNQAVGITGDSLPVDSDVCLRCHEEVLSKVTVGEGGVAMSHKEVAAAGIPCIECHEGTGHDRRQTSATMSDCVTCHDSKTASSECKGCHQRDPVAASFVSEVTGRIRGSGDIVYPAVRAANRDCGACHELERECDGCHGIRMPHSPSFKDGAHARNAAFDLKLQCWNCHDPVECGACHTSFNPKDGSSSHAGNWKLEHRTASWDAGCVCHSQRSSRKEPICYLCHEKDHELRPALP